MTIEPQPPFRVLCIDDNRDIADSAALLMRVVGFDALSCYDGATALKLAEEFRPSVCLIDLHMPGMDGDELALELRKHPWSPILLVAMTAMSNEESRSRTLAAGFDLHLVKPVDPKKLVEVVDTLFHLTECEEVGAVPPSRTS